MSRGASGRTLREDFDCIVCMDLMLPPIKMCVSGHSLCSSCEEKVECCPVCRKEMAPTRNLALEGLVEKCVFGCRYREGGCCYRGPGLELKAHEEKCAFTLKECPLKQRFRCHWVGQLADVLVHCRRKHPLNVYVSDKLKLNLSLLNEKHTEEFVMVAHRRYFLVKVHVDFEEDYVEWDAALWDGNSDKQHFGFDIEMQAPGCDEKRSIRVDKRFSCVRQLYKDDSEKSSWTISITVSSQTLMKRFKQVVDKRKNWKKWNGQPSSL